MKDSLISVALGSGVGGLTDLIISDPCSDLSWLSSVASVLTVIGFKLISFYMVKKEKLK